MFKKIIHWNFFPQDLFKTFGNNLICWQNFRSKFIWNFEKRHFLRDKLRLMVLFVGYSEIASKKVDSRMLRVT